MTAVPVGIVLAACGVPLAAMFGLLTFLFNFIPNVGSVLAVALPLLMFAVQGFRLYWRREEDAPPGALVRRPMCDAYVSLCNQKPERIHIVKRQITSGATFLVLIL